MKPFIAACLLLIALDAASQALTRKAVFVKGQQFERVAKARSTNKFTVLGEEKESIDSNMHAWLFTVTDVKDTAYLISNCLSRKVLYIKLGKRTAFDSDSAGDAAHPVFGELLMEGIGKVAETVVGKSGRIIPSVDTVSVLHGVMANMGMWTNLLNASKRPGVNYELIADLPAKQVRKGDSWTDSVMIQGTKGFVKSTIKDITGQVATITQTGKFLLIEEMKQVNSPLTMKLDIDLQGELTFDIKTGILKSVKNLLTASGTLGAAKYSTPVGTIVETELTITPRHN